MTEKALEKEMAIHPHPLRDWGAWWAAIYGVTQSQTRLKQQQQHQQQLLSYWRRKWQPTPVFFLENPRDGGAWWATVYGVSQSQTWLKRLSSSSSIHQWSEKAMPTHSSPLAWKIPWTEEPCRLQSMGSLRVRHDWATSFSLFTSMHWRRKWQPTPVFLPGESQGQQSLVGCHLWSRRVGHDWSDLAAAAAYISDIMY